MLDASLLVGFTWADQARSQAAAVALGLDEEATWSGARKLAAAYWDARHDFVFGVPTGSTDECIEMALESTASTVFLSDSGDNVTGGAAGDVPYVLERLLAHRVPKTLYAGLADAAAVEACYAAGAGASLSLSLGGKLDPVHGKPLSVTGTVKTLHQSASSGPQVIFGVDNVDVILSERRLAFTTLAQFTELGLDPLALPHRLLEAGLSLPRFSAHRACGDHGAQPRRHQRPA